MTLEEIFADMIILGRLSWACPRNACSCFCFVAGSYRKTVGHFALTRPFGSGTCLGSIVLDKLDDCARIVPDKTFSPRAADALFRHASHEMPRSKRPSDMRFITALPVTPANRIGKYKLSTR